MAFKTFAIDDSTNVTVYKRKASRSLRLSVEPNGNVRISIPLWTPYRVGVAFALSRLNWIKDQTKSSKVLMDGQAIGKAHHVQLIPSGTSQAVTSRLTSSCIVVKFPPHLTFESPEVQTAVRRASIRALRRQAEQLLPQRLAQLAVDHDFEYADVVIKQLKSRWGSCDQNKQIVLNLFLMQLPWELIDYVLLHELTHTKVLRHGPDFWVVMADLLPHLTELRKAMRQYQPVLGSSSF